MSTGCTHCGRIIRVGQDNALQPHTNAINGLPCPGSGQPPR